MAFDPSLDELVLFELPDRQLASRLLAVLGTERLAWRKDSDGAAVVAALLNPDRMDLALLLRAVQAWLARASLAAIRFELDGRIYLLGAAEAPPAAPVEWSRLLPAG